MNRTLILSRLRRKSSLNRERTSAAEADLDVAGLTARLNVVPFPVSLFQSVFPQPVSGLVLAVVLVVTLVGFAPST